MNKAVSWQTTQIYNTLSSVHWKDKRDKIVYSCKDTFCLGSQPFKVTSCGKQALYRVAASHIACRRPDTKAIPVFKRRSAKHCKEAEGNETELQLCYWGNYVRCPLKQTAGYLVLCVPGKSKRDCEQKRRKVLLGHVPSQGAPGTIRLYNSMWL